MTSNGEFTIRAPRVDEDLAATTQLVRDCEIADLGRAETTEEWVRTWWTLPDHDLSKDEMVALSSNGRMAGTTHVSGREPFSDMFAVAFVHPDFLGMGLGTQLAAKIEARARELARSGTRPSGSFVRQWVWNEEGPAPGLLISLGYSPVRFFFAMEAALDGPLPGELLRPPRGIEIRQIAPGEELAYHAANEEAFTDHWASQPLNFEQWKHLVIDSNPDWDPSLLLLAMDGDEIAGGILCRGTMNHDPKAAWVDDISVRRPWRRRGIGLSLLRNAFAELQRRGIDRVGLEVDAENPTGALKLYEAAGMHVERRARVYEKRVR